MLARLTRHVEPIVQGQKNDVRIASMPHLVLLGDSIFDNAQYTSGGPDVVSQVRNLLPSGWCASLLAVDGSTTVNIPDQIQRLPKESTHLVLSVGGNNRRRRSEEYFRSSIPSPPIPLFTLRRCPHDQQRKTRGQDGSLSPFL